MHIIKFPKPSSPACLAPRNTKTGWHHWVSDSLTLGIIPFPLIVSIVRFHCGTWVSVFPSILFGDERKTRQAIVSEHLVHLLTLTLRLNAAFFHGMVAEDALAAAKSAALKDLLSWSATHHGITDQPANGSKDVPARKTRRRRRKRHQSHHQASCVSLPEQPTPDIEYVPEPVHTLTSVTDEIQDGEHAAAVGQIVSAISRFAEMGPDAVDSEQPTDEHAAKSTGALPPKQPGSSIGLEQKSSSAAPNETANGAQPQKPQQPLSRKKLKEQRRNLIARLKEIADKPEVVESWDINSPDPILLVRLKAHRNSVPVPVNWSQKRKYLQNKRGMEKRPFQLPAYIVDTGVGSLRDAQIEADEKKTLKQRQREKMRAKTGRGVEIDTQRLHDAFFKFQTKPRLTKHGDVYYELKELETDSSQFTPGYLSEELRAALGITANDPPPWLINMQRYGPPPGYAGLKVTGVNAPIPPGARFGYQVGGWGKPAVDPSGKPVYGDVFGEGLSYGGDDPTFETPQAERDYLWGEMKSTPAGLSISADDIKTDLEDEDEEDGVTNVEKAVTTGWTPTQLRTAAGSEDNRVDNDDGRRTEGKEQGKDSETRKGIADGKLFTVLEQRKVSVGSSGMMGSSHIYKIDKADESESRREDVIDTASNREEVAGVVSEKENGVDKRKREVNEKEGKRGRPTKRQKEFKF